MAPITFPSSAVAAKVACANTAAGDASYYHWYQYHHHHYYYYYYYYYEMLSLAMGLTIIEPTEK